MPPNPSPLHDPLFLAIAVPVATGVIGLLGWAGKKLFDKRLPAPSPQVQNVAHDVYQTGNTNVTAPGATITIQSAPSARELAQEQLRAARDHRRAQEQALQDMQLCVTLAIDPLRNFLENRRDAPVAGQIDSALREWRHLRPTSDVVEPRLIEECDTFFGDVEHHFVTMAFEGPPTEATAMSLLRHARHLLPRIGAQFPRT